MSDPLQAAIAKLKIGTRNGVPDCLHEQLQRTVYLVLREEQAFDARENCGQFIEGRRIEWLVEHLRALRREGTVTLRMPPAEPGRLKRRSA